MLDYNYYASKVWNAYYLARYSRNTIREAEKAIEDTIVECKGNSPEYRLRESLTAFRYEKDKFDFTNDPVLFQIRRKGDCDDYANYCAHVLSACGLYCRLLSVFAPQGGHMVCAFMQDNVWSHIGNWSVGDTGPFQEYNDLGAITESIFPAWDKYTVREPKTYKLVEVKTR